MLTRINFFLSFLCQLFQCSYTLIDNEVMADPHIMCDERAMGIAVATKHPYFGRIFVNGLSDQSQCVRKFNSKYTAGRFEIPIGACDMRIQRTTAPKPGLEYSTNMVVSFHDELLTSSDRTFHIKCRYHQANQSIGSFFEVSMMPTVVLTNSFPMPACKYTLHIDKLDGPEAQFAKIGDSVYHKWQCDTTTSAIYGMKIQSCFIDDGRSRRYQLLDETGCSMDPLILPEITYHPSLTTAFTRTNVFKFADRPHIFFQCQLYMCVKSTNECDGLLPPKCHRNGLQRRSLNKSSITTSAVEQSDMLSSGLYDIVSPTMVVLDLGDERKFDSYVKRRKSDGSQVCLPQFGFASLVGCNIVTLSIASLTICLLMRRSQRSTMIKTVY